MKTRIVLSLVGCLFFVASLSAADWPQWRGPNRDGVAKETGLLAKWPKAGPTRLWTFQDAGLGFSSPAIVGKRLYIMGAKDEQTYLICLDIADKNPKELWRYKIGPLFTFKGNTWGDGPRSSPTVDGDRVYALTGHGELVCVGTDGKLVWRKNLQKDLGGVMMTEWGFSESVLIDGDKLICTPGGKSGTLAALNKKTGAVLWQSKKLTDAATYASIVAAEFGGVRQYVALTYVKDGGKAGGVAGVKADDGELLWYTTHYKGDTYAAAATPIVVGDYVYVTEGYTGGCELLTISKKGDTFSVAGQYKRRTRKVMQNKHGGVLRIGDYVYGHGGRSWICQNWKTGREKWEDRFRLRCLQSGSLIAADGNLYLYSDEGTVVMIKASPDGWQEQGRFDIPMKWNDKNKRDTHIRAAVWTHPVIANGCLYLRDQEYLFCYDIRAK